MKKLVKGAVIGVGIVVVLLVLNLCPLSTYDYSLWCTKCLREFHVEERQLIGFTYWKASRLTFEGHDLNPVFGHSCEHVFRQGGFGRTIGWFGGTSCGITGEGGLFATRWFSLSQTFRLNERIHDNELLKETFLLVDSLMPPDATLAFYKDKKRYLKSDKLGILGSRLAEAQNRADWEVALAEARKMDEPVTSN